MEAPQEVARPTTWVSSTKPPARRRFDLTGLIFLLPFLIAYALFLIWPIILGFRMSLFNWSLVSGGASEFLGLENYRELFGDPVFWSSMWHTVLFTLLSTPPLVLIALVLAMLVNRVAFAQWFFRFSFFAPFRPTAIRGGLDLDLALPTRVRLDQQLPHLAGFGRSWLANR
jgi:multiple sugar transport system permease protein